MDLNKQIIYTYGLNGYVSMLLAYLLFKNRLSWNSKLFCDLKIPIITRNYAEIFSLKMGMFFLIQTCYTTLRILLRINGAINIEDNAI